MCDQRATGAAEISVKGKDGPTCFVRLNGTGLEVDSQRSGKQPVSESECGESGWRDLSAGDWVGELMKRERRAARWGLFSNALALHSILHPIAGLEAQRRRRCRLPQRISGRLRVLI